MGQNILHLLWVLPTTFISLPSQHTWFSEHPQLSLKSMVDLLAPSKSMAKFLLTSVEWGLCPVGAAVAQHFWKPGPKWTCQGHTGKSVVQMGLKPSSPGSQVTPVTTKHHLLTYHAKISDYLHYSSLSFRHALGLCKECDNKLIVKITNMRQLLYPAEWQNLYILAREMSPGRERKKVSKSQALKKANC